MTIASSQFEDVGPHLPVEGPYGSGGNFPQPSWKPGTVVAGDQGAELIFLSLNVVAGYTANQGDIFVWDNTMTACRSGENAASVTFDIGLNVGTIWFGGMTGNNTGITGNWSYVFTPGLYGIWCQRAGASLANISVITTLAVPTTATAAPGRMAFLALGTNTNAIAPGSLGYMPTSKTFTGDLLAGSATILNVSGGRWLQKGMRVTGTGIPTTTASPSTHIIDINGSTVTLSAAATASNNTVTVTALTNSTSVVTVSGSPTLTNAQYILGFYPNQVISGTGIPNNTQIVSITGTSGNYTILMSANATASASNIAAVTTGFTNPTWNYNEVMLNWPYFTTVTN